jgi:hypothetical protein
MEKANTTLELLTSNDTTGGGINITLSSGLPPEINQTFSLTSLGKYITIDASEDLKNNLTPAWVHAAGVATADINGFAGYVWANISHLSTFGIVGSYPAVSQPVTPSSGGSSGGGGGGGGPSGEDFAFLITTKSLQINHRNQ